jgi:lipoate-protein ligase A
MTLNEIYRAIRAAIARATQHEELDLSMEEANTLMVHGGDQVGARGILGLATVMLVPYCAKPPTCKWRNRDGCPECGLCEVGDAYRLARERGMRVISINNFEHLCSVLTDLRAQEVPAYVGMCCEHFYLKRQHAFRAAGIPAVLMDISGANCYELQQEDQAYAGQFQAQSRLNVPVMEKVMRFVPRSELGAQANDIKKKRARIGKGAKRRVLCEQRPEPAS